MDMDDELQYPSQEAMEDWLRRNRRDVEYMPESIQLPVPVPEPSEPKAPAVARTPIIIDMA